MTNFRRISEDDAMEKIILLEENLKILINAQSLIKRTDTEYFVLKKKRYLIRLKLRNLKLITVDYNNRRLLNTPLKVFKTKEKEDKTPLTEDQKNDRMKELHSSLEIIKDSQKKALKDNDTVLYNTLKNNRIDIRRELRKINV